MNTEPKAGHDGAFIDADDLEAAAEAVAVANGSLRQVRSILVVLILLATAALWLGFIGHGIAWLFDHTLAYPLRGGWDMWPL
jgi:hypothetical protein